MVVTAAHNIFDHWEDSTKRRLLPHIYAVTETATFNCALNQSWLKDDDPYHSDLASLSCTLNHLGQFRALETELEPHALVAATKPTQPWQLLAYGGFIHAAILDRYPRRPRLVLPDRSVAEFKDTRGGSFLLLTGRAGNGTTGKPQPTPGRFWSDAIGSAEPAGSASAPGPQPYVDMLTESPLKGFSGGPIIGQKCEAYGVCHGKGAVGVYCTFALLKEACRNGSTASFCYRHDAEPINADVSPDGSAASQ